MGPFEIPHLNSKHTMISNSRLYIVNLDGYLLMRLSILIPSSFCYLYSYIMAVVADSLPILLHPLVKLSHHGGSFTLIYTRCPWIFQLRLGRLLIAHTQHAAIWNCHSYANSFIARQASCFLASVQFPCETGWSQGNCLALHPWFRCIPFNFREGRDQQRSS